MFRKGGTKLAPFAVLDGSPPPDHVWSQSKPGIGGKTLRRIQKEHKALSESLPDGAFVRTWESSLSCLRVLLLGPVGTPYEFAPFAFDMYLDESFPSSPPQLFFHSWTQGQGPCNPNLYEDGKVCLSLLGTWPGDDKGESWTKDSTILQVIVSLLGLVLVKEPYFNEAGYEVRKGSVECEIPSAIYSERAFLRTRRFISHAGRNPVPGFESEIRMLYFSGPALLSRAISSAIDVAERSKKRTAEQKVKERTVSPGGLIPLIRSIERMISDATNEKMDVSQLSGALQSVKSL